MLRRVRLAAGLSQAELAERMDSTQAYVSRAERGLEKPPLPTLIRFARACGYRFWFEFRKR
jgi:transcriptional regulator with XRE-family HTH domain